MENKKEEELKRINKPKIKIIKNSPNKKDKNKNEIFSLGIKVKKELKTLPAESRHIFQVSLNKHSFDKEVFIPSSLKISKKEYKDKDYMLNTLITFENEVNKQNKYVEPLRKENNIFSKQYKYIKEENLEHQKDYVKNVQKFYENMGYSRSGIEYKDNENIFSPSFILDHEFGKNDEKDSYKYKNIEYKKEYNKEQKLMEKWAKGVKEAKDNKNRIKHKELEDESGLIIDDHENMNKTIDEKIKENLIKLEKENLIQMEKEKEKEQKRKELELIKQGLIEEDRIKNMTKREYFFYNLQLKKDIQKTKESLEEFNKTNSNYFSPYKLKFQNLEDTDILYKNYNIIHPKKNKNYKEKIIFSSMELHKNNNNKKSDLEINKKFKIFNKFNTVKKNNIRKNLFNNEKSPISVTESNIFLSSNKRDSKKKQIDSLPNIPFMLDDDRLYNKIFKKEKGDDNNIENIRSEKLKKELYQKKDLNHLYNLLYSKKANFFGRYPYKNVESYFTKYTNKKIPVLNYKKGSNMHGFLDEFQQISEKNNFSKVAESVNAFKRELMNEKGLAHRYSLLDNEKLDVDKIQKMDERIHNLHYYYAEKLLANEEMDNLLRNND